MKINIQNLEHDLLEFDDEVEINFLDGEIKDFYPNKAQVHVVVDKFGSDYRLKVKLATVSENVCDRCLTEYKNQVNAKQSQVYHAGEISSGQTSEFEYLPSNAVEIDITDMLREMIVLQHPIKMLCREDCSGLCPRCGADLNNEECRCASDNIDPRWEQLRKLIK